MKAGHGAGKPTAKVIDEQADIYAFLFKTGRMVLIGFVFFHVQFLNAQKN